MSQSVTAINITSFGSSSGFDLPAGTSGSPNDAAVSGGNLVLTTIKNSQAGIAVYQTPFSASGSVSFDFTYNSSGGTGADGLSFFLLNGDELTGGATSVVPGGYGGGLGYADDGKAGITDGWLGLGFDTFGNYETSDQGDQQAEPGVSKPQPNTIGVRGAGSGTTGYAWLTGTPFTPGIDGTREVDVTLNDATGANGTPQETLTVRVSTDGGNTWTTPINDYVINQPVPGSLYFGFAASTGGSTDLHEIEAVKDSQLTFGAVTVQDTTTGITNPAMMSAGDNFSYTTTFFNNNTSAITATLDDAAPPNATNLAWTVTDGNSGQVLTGTGALTPAALTLALSSGDTDTVTVTGTVAEDASSGDLNHTLTATSAANGADPSQSVSVEIAAGGLTPAIITLAADQTSTTSDQSGTTPFSNATIYDGDTAGTVTLTVSLAEPALGTLSSTGATYDAATGTLTYSGTQAQAQAVLQGIAFTATAGIQEIGTSATTGLSVTVSDSGNGNSSTESRATVQVAYTDTGASISGQGQSVAAGQSAHSLLDVTVADPDFSGMTVSITVAGDASGSEGTFINASGWDITTSGSDLVYTRSFAPQADIGTSVSTAVQALTFSTVTGSAPGSTTVAFTVATTDDEETVADLSVPLTVSTPHVGPAATMGAAQAITDEQSAAPFSGSSLSDPDNLGLVLTVTIPGGASGLIGDFTNASAWTRAVSGNDVTYTLQVSAQPDVGAIANAALQALAFQPVAHVNPPGSAAQDTFSALAADTMGGSAELAAQLDVTAVADPLSAVPGPTQLTSDEAAAFPFMGTTVVQPDDTAIALTVSIPGGATGEVGDFTNASGWTRTVSGNDVVYALQLPAQTDAGQAAQAALRALNFQPAAHVADPNTSSTELFSVSLQDGSANVASFAQPLAVLAAADQPGISVTEAPATTDEEEAQPFAGVVVSDPDHTSFTVSATILGGASGTMGDFTNASAWTRVVSGNDVTYTQTFADQSASGTVATAALQALIFEPTMHVNPPGTTAQTGFVVGFTDAVSGASATAAVGLDVTAVEDEPVIQTGATQTGTDVAPGAPFATTTITDPDVSSMVLSVSFAATQGDFTGATGWTRTEDGGVVTYTLTLTQSLDIGVAATTALQGLLFQPTSHAAAQGTVSGDTFAVSAIDGGAATASGLVAFNVTSNVDRIVAAAGPVQAVSDEQAAQPFAGLSVVQPDDTAMSVSVTIAGGASGTVGDFTDTSAWTRSVSGSDVTYTLDIPAQSDAGAAAQAALQQLIFQPVAHVEQPGTMSADTFTVTLGDSAGNVQSIAQTLAVTSSEDAPRVSAVSQAGGTDDQSLSTPLSGVSVTDPDRTGLALKVTIPGGASGTVGDFTDASGWTRTVSGPDVTYTLELPIQPDVGAAAQAALQALTFQPAAYQDQPGTVVQDAFLVSATDASGASAVATATLPVTSSHASPTLVSANPAEVTDEQAAQPFSATFIADPDDIGGTLAVIIAGGASGTVGDFTNASAWTRSVSGSDVTYTLQLGAQTDIGGAATAALQALSFQPATHQTAPGALSQDVFPVTFTDGTGDAAAGQLLLPVMAFQDPVSVSSGAGDGSSGGSNSASSTASTTYDVATAAPFASFVVTDPDDQSVTATVVVTGGAEPAVGDLTAASALAWTRTVSGSDTIYTQTFAAQPDVGAAVQASLQALRFAPARLNPGASLSVPFSASITPLGGTTTQIASTSIAVTGALRPFLDLSLVDSDPTDIVTVAATLPSAAIGDYAALGLGTASGNTYDIMGTPGQVTADLHALAFLPSSADGAPPGNYSAAVVSSSSAAALVDTGSGDDTLMAAAPGAAAFGGSGNDTFFGNTEGSALVGGSGTNVFVGVGSDTISAGIGSSLVYSGAGDTTVFANGTTTVVGAAGRMDVYGAAGSVTTVFGGQGGLTFVGNGTATVIGATGQNQVYGGGGTLVAFGSADSRGTFWGGAAGGNVLVAGGGASTLVGATAGDLLVAQNAAQDTLVAGGGGETIQTSGSTGNDTYFGGTGDDVMALGDGTEMVVGGTGSATVSGGSGTMTLFAGSGATLVNGSASGGDTFVASSGNTTIWGGLGAANTYDIIAGHAGGSLTVDDFRVGTDTLSISGYSAADLTSALSGADTTPSGTMLTLSDGTGIMLVGLNHAQAAAAIGG